MIVVDTNAIAHLLLLGDRTESARAVFQKDARWAAPLLWRSEFRNVLSLQVRRGTLGRSAALEVMVEAEHLFRGEEYEVDSAQVLDLAVSSGCTAYDCEFVALAETLGVPLVTSDREILKAFPATAVPLAEYAKR